ncbi:MAG: hypothetical protein Q8N99_03190 [Nanoarchaeota archaeon]|nr:hypothetical protein [Nanoarchaeota archaeon]
MELSRRNFLTKVSAGLLGLLEFSNPLKAKDIAPSNYRISYEEWKQARELSEKRVPFDKEEERDKQLKYTKLAQKAIRILNNPNAAYNALSAEEKKEEQKMYKEHQNSITSSTNQTQQRPKRRRRIGDQIGDQIDKAFEEIFTYPFKIFDSAEREKYYYRKFYGGVEVPITDRNLNYSYRTIMYWDKKHWETYNKEQDKIKNQPRPTETSPSQNLFTPPKLDPSDSSKSKKQWATHT